jgi:hypothetical protein
MHRYELKITRTDNVNIQPSSAKLVVRPRQLLALLPIFTPHFWQFSGFAQKYGSADSVVHTAVIVAVERRWL